MSSTVPSRGPTPEQTAAALKRWARAEGFDPVGITSVEPPPHLPEYLAWVAAGRHADMAWLAEQAAVRADPRSLLATAKSVLCLGFHYWPFPGPPRQEQPHSFGGPRPNAEGRPTVSAAGAVASFARGRDYHRRLKRKLIRICRRLEAWLGRSVDTRCCIDIVPLMERDLAARAGLGWTGKNTMLLHPQRGSYLLLAEILIGLELPFDAPMADHCGSCTACLDACPTQAFPAPWVLDARRCISYLTIERRGELTEPEAEHLGPHIYGCDICQDVCPFNRKVGPTAEADFTRPVAEFRDVASLCDLLTLDEVGVAARFAGSAVMRAKRTGLLRNAAIALGHLGDRRAEPALRRAATDADPVVAGAARWALERLRCSGV